ncbi:Abi family protein [Microbacterium aquimaris]|uniref:Abi family protein n=1 Tax=Microbacterium aquimaris TaxID=459816 RepID=UPI002AD386C3|nr:Abi family protein [Microbacterium aquimaris]MDZ8275371.1 Abi family protein [Microbacterium aquimaris]
MTHDSSYAKPFKTVREQVALLASRGMDVGDRDDAEALLKRIGYYRLSGYWYPYREREVDGQGNAVVQSNLRAGTTLEHVRAIYDFDREIRAALFDALEAVEVAIRFQVGHTLGRRDIFAHRKPSALDPGFVTATSHAPAPRGPQRGALDATQPLNDDGGARESRHQGWLRRFDEQERRSQEAFAAHFRERYGPHFPVWVATEVMSFGTLAQLYDGAAQDDREQIAASLDIIARTGRGDAALLSNWLNHIRYIRNICAHHSRMWNRSFDVELASASHIPDLAHLSEKSQRRLYGTISILSFLLARVLPDSDWKTRIHALITVRTAELGLDLDAMGYPAGWETAAIWDPGYRRDPILAKRVALLADLDLSSNAATRDRLHSRPKKDRRSWLNYLRSRHALVWVTMGEAKLFPSFQINPDSGDIRQIVGDVNAELYKRLTNDGLDDEAIRWRILEWWFTPAEDTAMPAEQVMRGALELEDARASFPIFP